VLWRGFIYGQCAVSVLALFSSWRVCFVYCVEVLLFTVCCRFCLVVLFMDNILYVLWRFLFNGQCAVGFVS